MRSMSGYGRGEHTTYDRKVIVEIKSVNHRYNDINLRVPKILTAHESDMRKKLASEIWRGKTDVYVYIESYSESDIKIVVNKELALAYITALKNVEELCRDEITSGFTLKDVTTFPDVISVDKNARDETVFSQICETADAALNAALEQFLIMREAEGAAIFADVCVKLDAMSENVEKLKTRAPMVAEDYRIRFRARMEEFLDGALPDEARIATEAAIFAERSCVDEELTRLESHISQMSGFLRQSTAVGRKLDFLVQEMNREANTIGSKANDITITNIVLELKSDIEKIREQIQNVE